MADNELHTCDDFAEPWNEVQRNENSYTMIRSLDARYY